MKLIITGSIAFDYLMSFPGHFSDHFIEGKLDSISVSFLVESLVKRRGGCAANIAYNLALMGEHPLLVGSVGRDFTEYGQHLEKTGVDLSSVLIKDEEYTASFFANTDKRNNQIASFFTGAMRFAGEIDLAEIDAGEKSLTIISPNDPGAMSQAVHQCRALGRDFVYDPSQQIIWLDGDTLKDGATGAKILILNDYELEMFKKKTGLTEDEILNLCETLIVTLGEKGSKIHTREKVYSIPVAKLSQVMDPTGVGDAFRSGLMKGLTLDLGWEIAGRMGSLAATYVLETDGPQSHRYTFAEFVNRYCDNFGETEALRRCVSPS